MKKHITYSALALLTATALPALACPTVADLQKGIETRTADGSVEVHREARPDWVTLQVTYPEGDGSVLELYHGIYLHSTIPLVGGLPQLGERDSYATSEELRGWPRPLPDASWNNTTPGGGKATSGPQSAVQLGDCSYASTQVEITYNDDEDYTETYAYLLDLGIALLIKTEASDGTDNYEYTSIKALN